jgi:hypothetical protein
MTEYQNIPSSALWQVENLRMTAIISPTDQVIEQNWWEEVVGNPPQNKIHQPKVGIKQDQGSFGEGQLTLRIHPFGVDWLFGSIPNPFSSIFPSLGQFPEPLNPFIELINRWLENSPNLQRMAFGATLLLHCESLEKFYEEISKYLFSSRFSFDNATQFNYTINRPRESTCSIPDLKINRLSVWSLVRLSKAQAAINPGILNPGILSLPPSEISLAIRLQLDINTYPDFQGFLPPEKKDLIFEELIKLGQEIILKGDIQ